MSTILRALRRLEQEKAADELVELHESVVAPAPAPARRGFRSALLVAVAAVFAAGLGGIVTWQLLGGAGDFLPFAPKSVEVVASTPAPLVADESPSDAALENALAVLKPDTAILVDRRDRSARLAPVASPPPERVVEPETADFAPEISSEVVIHERAATASASAADESIAAARRLLEPEATQPEPEAREKLPPRVLPTLGPKPGARYADKPAAAPEPRRVAAARVEEKPEPRPAPRREAVAPAPRRAAVAPAPVSTGIPNVVVTKTIWHPSPERRSAIVEVEGRPEPLDLKEGDVVGDLVLTQIKPSGVVFDYEGVELVRKIGDR